MEMPGEKLVIKLWETIAEKGIGSLFRPWQMRREGRASIELKREELLTIAQAERDADLIRSGERLPAFALPQLAHIQEQQGASIFEARASETLVADTVKREANITRALLHAESTLEQDTQQPSDKKVDEDWLFRWRDSAAQVSSEELQNLWGRVLAGEVKAPGSYSLRTLEFLKNISQQEAEAIAKLSEFILDNVIYREAEEIFEKCGITFDFLLNMQQLGIISGVEALGMSTTWKSADRSKYLASFISNSLVLIATADDPNLTTSMPTYLLTPLGKQVMSLGSFESNVEYLEKVAIHLKTQGVSVKLAKYLRITESRIRPYEVREL